MFRGKSPKIIEEHQKNEIEEAPFSSKKFSRFLIKNNDWSKNVQSQKRKRFFGRKRKEIIDKKSDLIKPSKGHSSFVSLDYIKGIVGEKSEIKYDKKTDFYKKDIIQKHPSIFDVREMHLMAER